MKMRTLCLLAMLPFTIQAAFSAAPLTGGKMVIRGTIAASPCKIANGDENLSVNLKEISLRDLIRNGKSKLVPFTIHLIDCDPSTYSKVKITFSGIESSKISNRLEITPVDPGSDMSAVAIGLQLGDGTEVKLDQELLASTISSSTTNLTFHAYVEGLKNDLKQGNVGLGQFTAVANYIIEYQ